MIAAIFVQGKADEMERLREDCGRQGHFFAHLNVLLTATLSRIHWTDRLNRLRTRLRPEGPKSRVSRDSHRMNALLIMGVRKPDRMSVWFLALTLAWIAFARILQASNLFHRFLIARRAASA